VEIKVELVQQKTLENGDQQEQIELLSQQMQQAECSAQLACSARETLELAMQQQEADAAVSQMKFTDSITENLELQENIDTLTASLDVKTQLLEEVSADALRLEEQNCSMEETIKQREVDVAQFQKALQVETQALEQTLQLKETALGQQTAEAQALEQQLMIIQTELREKSRELTVDQACLEQRQQRLDQITTRDRKLQADLDRATAGLQVASDQTKTLEVENCSLKSKLRELQLFNESQQQQLMEADSVISNLETLGASIYGLEAELNQLKSQQTDSAPESPKLSAAIQRQKMRETEMDRVRSEMERSQSVILQ